MLTTKYIFVSGGVLSGLVKGTVIASLFLLLKSHGFSVVPVKCENYLNVDAGLINPIEHGDPFLCEDGAETDMDLGTYERFLNMNLSLDNFITMGQIYKSVIDKERNFFYKGEDVEAIPHVTDEIINRIKTVGKKYQAEIVVIELGGTAGEYQNSLYYEASRIMKLKYRDPVVHIHVSYLPTPPHLGEPKTKPTQLSVKLLNSMGIQPDFIVARADRMIDDRRKDRFALFCNVRPEHIISSPDVSNVYELPLIFAQQQFSQKILKLLNLKPTPLKLGQWQNLIQLIKAPQDKAVTIAIVGKYFATGDYNLNDSYAALIEAINHAAWHVKAAVKIKAVNAETSMGKMNQQLSNCQGIIVPIGLGPRGVEGMIEAIKYGRENKIPYLGLCFGMQLAVIEFARNVCGLKSAHTTEVNPKTPDPVIHIIPEQQRNLNSRAYGGTMRLGAWEEKIVSNTLAYRIYRKNRVWERHRHRYEFNNQYAAKLEKSGLIISSRSVKENLAETIELPAAAHPFFFGTQGHPEYKSRPLQPHPVFLAFVKAAKKL